CARHESALNSFGCQFSAHFRRRHGYLSISFRPRIRARPAHRSAIAPRQRGQRLLSVGQWLVFEERELDCELHVNDIVSSFMGRGRLLAEGRHDDRQFPRLRERLRLRATDYGSWTPRCEPLAEREPEQFGDDEADANPVTAQAVKLREAKDVATGMNCWT